MIDPALLKGHPLLERVPPSKLRVYDRASVCSFWLTSQEFGEFSNMAAGFPLQIGVDRFGSSEALYQACRFTEFPDIQRRIRDAISPRMAKQRAHDYISLTRSDWKTVRRDVMRWVIRIKAAQHKKQFLLPLVQTGDLPVVEESTRDVYWGAVRVRNHLIGVNVLGRLLMELREGARDNTINLMAIDPPKIENFLLFGASVPPVLPTSPR